jgi:uncharacterized protein DUF4383
VQSLDGSFNLEGGENMSVQRVAQLFGIVFVLVGILGFVPGVVTNGMLLGIFPVNGLHNVVHLAFGVWGLVAARSFGGAKTYGQLGGIIYIVLAALGFAEPLGSRPDRRRGRLAARPTGNRAGVLRVHRQAGIDVIEIASTSRLPRAATLARASRLP